MLSLAPPVVVNNPTSNAQRPLDVYPFNSNVDPPEPGLSCHRKVTMLAAVTNSVSPPLLWHATTSVAYHIFSSAHRGHTKKDLTHQFERMH